MAHLPVLAAKPASLSVPDALLTLPFEPAASNPLLFLSKLSDHSRDSEKPPRGCFEKMPNVKEMVSVDLPGLFGDQDEQRVSAKLTVT